MEQEFSAYAAQEKLAEVFNSSISLKEMSNGSEFDSSNININKNESTSETLTKMNAQKQTSNASNNSFEQEEEAKESKRNSNFDQNEENLLSSTKSKLSSNCENAPLREFYEKSKSFTFSPEKSTFMRKKVIRRKSRMQSSTVAVASTLETAKELTLSPFDTRKGSAISFSQENASSNATKRHASKTLGSDVLKTDTQCGTGDSNVTECSLSASIFNSNLLISENLNCHFSSKLSSGKTLCNTKQGEISRKSRDAKMLQFPQSTNGVQKPLKLSIIDDEDKMFEVGQKSSFANENLNLFQHHEISTTSFITDEHLDNTITNRELKTNTCKSKIVSDTYENSRKTSCNTFNKTNKDILSTKANSKEHNFSKLNTDANAVNEPCYEEIEELECQGSNRVEILNKEVASENNDVSEDSNYKGQEENVDETSYFEKIRLNCIERPLLPLSPQQKQHSLPCSNLVQTLKGFSKRHSGENCRLLSTELSDKTLPKKELQEFRTKDKELEGPKHTKQNDIEDPLITKKSTWYHAINAKEASKRLLRMQQDGAFLIRPASNPTKNVSYTLCVTQGGSVYNLHIHRLKNGQLCLGRKKEQEETFSSLLEMIRYHQDVPISIFKSSSTYYVNLLVTPPQ